MLSPTFKVSNLAVPENQAVAGFDQIIQSITRTVSLIFVANFHQRHNCESKDKTTKSILHEAYVISIS